MTHTLVPRLPLEPAGPSVGSLDGATDSVLSRGASDSGPAERSDCPPHAVVSSVAIAAMSTPATRAPATHGFMASPLSSRTIVPSLVSRPLLPNPMSNPVASALAVEASASCLRDIVHCIHGCGPPFASLIRSEAPPYCSQLPHWSERPETAHRCQHCCQSLFEVLDPLVGAPGRNRTLNRLGAPVPVPWSPMPSNVGRSMRDRVRCRPHRSSLVRTTLLQHCGRHSPVR